MNESTRSNLVGMGVLPLEFKPGENRETLGLTGHEVFENRWRSYPGSEENRVNIRAKSADGKETAFTAIVRVDTPEEVSYYQHGGILQYVLRQMLE